MSKEQGMPNHQPVLLSKVIEVLDPKPGETFFDGTAGYGGHAGAIFEKIGPSGRLILVDRDYQAVEHLKKMFPQAQIIRQDYASVAKQLAEEGGQVDMVLLDLGVSSPQLDEPDRGFSFRSNAPLDMRMDRSQELSAADIVNFSSQTELANLIYQFGEERFSRQIAKKIVEQRPIADTKQLADIVSATVKSKTEIHPATRTFQALRIAVNQEIEQLQTALPDLVKILKPNGRITVISFHSLEDRIVKQFFNQESRDCICNPDQPICVCNHVASLRKLTTKAIKGSDYDTINPRARSARLRAAVKIKTTKGKPYDARRT